MSNGSRKSKRSERVASLELPPGQLERAWNNLRRRDVLGRIALALLAATVICVVIRGWNPPDPRARFPVGYTPARDITVAVPFTKADRSATDVARERARSQAPYVYEQDADPLIRLRSELRNTLAELTAAESLDKLDPKIWKEFQLPSTDGAKPPSAEEQNKQFLEFREAFTPQEKLDKVKKAIDEAFAPFDEHGLLDKLVQDLGRGNLEEILVYPKGHPTVTPLVFKVADVLIGDGTSIRDALRRREELEGVADRLFEWLRPKLPTTLHVDDRLTKEKMADAEAEVPEVLIQYSVGQSLAKGGQPLSKDQLELLGLEYTRAMELRRGNYVGSMIVRALAITALFFTALILCGIYMRYRQRGPLISLTRLLVLLSLAVAAVALARWLSTDPLRGEIAPVLLFGMTMVIVYRRALALLLTGVVALVVVLALGQDLQEFFLLMGASAAAILNLEHIRTSTKLIFVGMFAGVVACLLQLGMGIIDNQPVNLSLIKYSCLTGLWALGAGVVVFASLPLVERLFGVLTDLTLLHYGDVSRPLLQELVRRAPSTYNHSLTVGSIAEAAADSIHARGLLVRIGAYYHDIGKMLKPDYFVENQQPDQNRHESLAPAMSTLVIFAHIKDGADLGRQHHLPQPIIDLIVQHHGTTRVEYFYGRATERQQSDPNGGEVDENTYRYPGPKPQTKEAAVLMLADAVESASRTLVDPAPARIEGLVRDISEQRLRDGQFDESGLTLRELRTIEKSLAMSLTSIYHGRIKYPEQKSG